MLTFAMLFVFTAKVLCQDVSFPDVNTITPENLFQACIEPTYALVVLLSGYLSIYIPGIKKWAPFYRVAAFALVAGIGFSLFGFSAWKLASTYFLSSGLYLIILRNIFSSPRLPS